MSHTLCDPYAHAHSVKTRLILGRNGKKQMGGRRMSSDEQLAANMTKTYNTIFFQDNFTREYLKTKTGTCEVFAVLSSTRIRKSKVRI